MAHNSANTSNMIGVPISGGVAMSLLLGAASNSWFDFLPYGSKFFFECLALLLLLFYVNSLLSRKALNPSGKMQCDWPHEIVVVTGGSGGIGRALVEKLEQLGATVAILDISPPSYKTSNGTHYFRTDISSKKDVNVTCEQIAAKLGSPTILIANAGLHTGNTILGALEHDLCRTFDTNVLGTLFCIQSFLPAMITRNHGHVVVVSSIKAYLTTIKAVDYAASKAALNTVVEGLQTELKHMHGNPNVKASGIYPAIVRTNMSAKLVQPVNSLFMPILEPEAVADRMVQILQSGQSQMVMIPALSGVAPWIRSLPHWLRVAVQDLAARAMK